MRSLINVLILCAIGEPMDKDIHRAQLCLRWDHIRLAIHFLERARERALVLGRVGTVANLNIALRKAREQANLREPLPAMPAPLPAPPWRTLPGATSSVPERYASPEWQAKADRRRHDARWDTSYDRS